MDSFTDQYGSTGVRLKGAFRPYKSQAEADALGVTAAPAKGEAPKPDPDALPEGFPGHKVLTEAGHTTFTAVRGLSRDDLIALDGIGEKTADAILEELKGGQ
jgi:hypothetical protein